MSESFDEIRVAVCRLVDAARRIHDRAPSLASQLAESTGLSSEGVVFALERSLEWDATRDEIEAFIRRATPTSEVTVVLSANVFTASLRAIAWARAKSSKVTVRASRREPPFTELLLQQAADPCIALASDIDFESLTRGEVHVYGRDETIASIRARLSPSVTFLGHGSGMGIAVVTKPELTLEHVASALADDVVTFDQRGCLSPRIAFVRRGFEGDLAHATHRALERRSAAVPRGRLDEGEFVRESVYRQTLAATGTLVEGSDHSVAFVDEVRSGILPPVGRNLLLVPIDDTDEVPTLLGALRPMVVAIGSDDVPRLRTLFGETVRVSALGTMQRPRLDGPVDNRGL